MHKHPTNRQFGLPEKSPQKLAGIVKHFLQKLNLFFCKKGKIIVKHLFSRKSVSRKNAEKGARRVQEGPEKGLEWGRKRV